MPISELLGPRIMVTLPLALLSMVLSVAVAIPVGVYAASRRGRTGDVVSMGVAQVGVAIPNFWLGLLLILLFALQLGWFPASGFAGWEGGFWNGIRSLFLPALALALPLAAILARVTRSAVIETLGEDFVRTARAKGLTRKAALWRHAVPNALIPVVTIIGLQFSFLLAGTIIIENVFNLPGIGRLVFQAIAQRDLVTVQSLVTLLAASVIAVNFIVDLVYGFIDPRLSTGAADERSRSPSEAECLTDAVYEPQPFDRLLHYRHSRRHGAHLLRVDAVFADRDEFSRQVAGAGPRASVRDG